MSEGATFGPYRVVRKLGVGGMGVVWLGEHQLIGRRAAIKVLHRERSAQRESVERFFNEARATSAASDPGIVQIYDFGVNPQGIAYLVMEYLDGEPLSVRLRNRGRLPGHDALRITRQIASSLAAAHVLGIVHRDLKPENLFVVRDGALGGERIKIVDFGIAKLDCGSQGRVRTRPGAVMGTPAYMSPEQCNGTATIDQRTDIYSLGCVLYHLLTGKPPYDIEGAGAVIAAHMCEPVPVPSTNAPDLPAVVDALVARCLAKRPEDRFATMLELQQSCDAALVQFPAAPAMPSIVKTLDNTLGQRSVSATRMIQRGLWYAVVVAAVAAGIVVAVATTRHSPTELGSIPAAVRAPVQPPVPPTIRPITRPAAAATPVTPPTKTPTKRKPAVDPYEDRT